MISLRPSLITEHHSVSSLNDPAREASPCSRYLRPARDVDTTCTVGRDVHESMATKVRAHRAPNLLRGYVGRSDRSAGRPFDASVDPTVARNAQLIRAPGETWGVESRGSNARRVAAYSVAPFPPFGKEGKVARGCRLRRNKTSVENDCSNVSKRRLFNTPACSGLWLIYLAGPLIFWSCPLVIR